MNAAVLRRGLADGWRGLAITTVVVAAMILLGLAVYQDIDLSVYDSLPEQLRSLMGIPEHADAAVLAYNEMLASIGALAFVGVAVAIGAHAIAGEEGGRRLPLVLSAPISRLSYATTKAAALILLVVTAGVAMWVSAELAPKVLGLEIGDAKLLALMAHLTACALFHGSLAFAVGAMSGRQALAGGLGAGVMVLGWVGAGLLPMQPDLDWLADYLPWTWFNGGRPLVEGIDAVHLALLLGGTVVLIAAGIFGFASRELRLSHSGAGLIAWVARIPGLAWASAPTVQGRTLLGLRLTAGCTLLLLVALVMGLLMGLAMGPMYASMEDQMAGFAASFPDSMVAMFGGGDLTTASGFLHLETMGMMGPIAVILVATAAAVSGVAGEERAHRLSILLAQPVSRGRVYWLAAAAMAAHVLMVAVVTFLGLWGAVALARLDVDLAYVAQACVLLACLGWCFGALALFLSAGTGRPAIAMWGTTGLAVVSYFGYTLLSVAGQQEWGWWSPMRAYLHGPVLEVGWQWWQPVWLLIAAVLLTVAGLPLLTRRDLH